VKYAWMKVNEEEFPVQAMCKALDVVRSAYYKWRSTPQTAHNQRDKELSALVQEEFKKTLGAFMVRCAC